MTRIEIDGEGAPLSGDALRNLCLDGETLIRLDGAGEWIKAAHAEPLVALLRPEGVMAQAVPHWGNFQRDHRVREGYRQYSSVLWGIPSGQSWEASCAQMPATVRGRYFPHPTRCVNTGMNMWGEFDVPDSSCATPPSFGRFQGRVLAQWLDDGRTMRLEEDFAFIDPHGIRWDAPAGSVVDGASIPSYLWSVIGGPFAGKYRNASVVHDVACGRQDRPWTDVHWMFHEAMLSAGVDPAKAQVMFAGVWAGGPRW